MMKRFLAIVSTVLLTCLILCRPAFGEQDVGGGPEGLAREFYAWFIQSDSDSSYPLKQQAIERYVAKGTVAKLRDEYDREGPPNGVDYFLKVQDYDCRDWLSHIETHPAIFLEGVAVVPVTFGSKDRISVLVFMRKFGGYWKITKVDDILDHS